METEAPQQLLMTKREACQRYSLSLRHLSDLVSSGVLPQIKLGRRCVRLPITQCDAAMEALVTGGGRKK